MLIVTVQMEVMMKELKKILERAVEEQVSDIFIVAGRSVSVRKQGVIAQLDEESLSPSDTEALVKEIYRCANGRDISQLETRGDDDFSFTQAGLSRFRVSAYRQRGALSAVIRVITFELPKAAQIGVPDYIFSLCDAGKGMVLVTGPAGSGKSTTLACMVDRINTTQKKHVITLEDPLEYLHKHDQSIVTQREISTDTVSYVAALRAALRQSPDVILLGEMRDAETIRTAMTAAETGHLVIATMHTRGAVNAIDRIIDVFPGSQQEQVRAQLSMVLDTVVSQQLLGGTKGRLVPAFEIMRMNSAVRGLIRDNKTYQINNVIAAGSGEGMMTMDQSLLSLFRGGEITAETAVNAADSPEQMRRKIGQ